MSDGPSGKLHLMLGFHAHLASSADDDEFEELYRNRLKPFITALGRYPKIPAVLHCSGPLFTRVEQKKPELFLLIKELTARKQLELLGGGFYEPAMPLLPLADKIGQIEMLTTYIRQNFGRKPQGCWLAHSQWEQPLVGVLNACGMAYTFLSEEQFAAAENGIHDEAPGVRFQGKALPGLVSTEDQGKLLVVFPVFSSLASMGTRGVLPVLRNLSLPEGQTALLPVLPDFPSGGAGEEPFFADLSAFMTGKTKEINLELTSPGRAYRSSSCFPRRYFLPSGDSSCPLPRALLTARRGPGDLYARIYFVHNLINQLRGDKSRKRTAREELWKAEGAEAFCPSGTDGGTAVRNSCRSILAAERIVREKDFKPSLLVFDVNLDRTAEFLFQDRNVNCYVQGRGASVFEFDYLPRGWNYLDTFVSGSRAFTDMLLPGDFVPEEDMSGAEGAFSPERFPPESRFCEKENYTAAAAERAKLKAVFTLPPQKTLPFGFIELQKTYQLEKNTLYLSYVLRNGGDKQTVLCFVPRFDFVLAGEELLFRKTQGEDERSAAPRGAVRRVLAVEEQGAKHGGSLSAAFQSPCDLYYDGTSQARSFLPVFQVFLNPGDEWENRITLGISAKSRSVK